ncbi:hypothetical protein [Bdellovibrio sp. HCB2-146]|uniref:hypothetical protein n=1 Tax=Bdellovibrio sp. HCB2-146 TaxID=3394362 RepID=UPI0039BC9FE4
MGCNYKTAYTRWVWLGTLAKTDVLSKAFPKAQHLTFLADDKKEKTREQRYLNHNKRKFDPLFKINHTCAKLRYHIKRLTRRNWCTTKKPEHLELGLYLYIAKSNNFAFLK